MGALVVWKIAPRCLGLEAFFAGRISAASRRHAQPPARIGSYPQYRQFTASLPRCRDFRSHEQGGSFPNLGVAWRSPIQHHLGRLHLGQFREVAAVELFDAVPEPLVKRLC